MYKIDDIDDYLNRLSDKQAEVLIKNCNKYKVYPNICAWYDDMEDFYVDWIHDNNIFETEDEADERYEDGVGTGEFVKFNNGEIVRISM